MNAQQAAEATAAARETIKDRFGSDSVFLKNFDNRLIKVWDQITHAARSGFAAVKIVFEGNNREPLCLAIRHVLEAEGYRTEVWEDDRLEFYSCFVEEVGRNLAEDPTTVYQVILMVFWDVQMRSDVE